MVRSHPREEVVTKQSGSTMSTHVSFTYLMEVLISEFSSKEVSIQFGMSMNGFITQATRLGLATGEDDDDTT